MPDGPTPHFTWRELRAPADDATVRARLAQVAAALEVVRAEVGRPVIITSGYRSPEANARCGGSKTSQHLLGAAADFKVTGWTARELAQAVIRSGVVFDQLIFYEPPTAGKPSCHISVAPRPRREVLRFDGVAYHRESP
jgi:hypothetical protein